MNLRFIDKIAYTKENKKIGKVITIVGNRKKVVLLKKPHMIIKHKSLTKGVTKLQMPVKRVFKVDKNKIWLDISNNELLLLENVRKVEITKRGIKAKNKFLSEQINHQAALQERVKQLPLKQFF